MLGVLKVILKIVKAQRSANAVHVGSGSLSQDKMYALVFKDLVARLIS